MTAIDNKTALALASPFNDEDVKWKPQITTKGKDKQAIMRNGQQVAGCTAHIDARAVMNRLDEVVGVGSWSDSYQVLPNGRNVQCTLTVCGVSKSDVGEPNDGGFADSMKAAYSDALKRAAVKFGIGRYLYDMEMEWLPFDGYRIIDQPAPKHNQPKKMQNGSRKTKPVASQEKPKQIGKTGDIAQSGLSAYGFSPDDEVVVIGKKDEKLGTVVGLDETGTLVVVKVGGKQLKLSPDKLRIIEPAVEQEPLFADGQPGNNYQE